MLLTVYDTCTRRPLHEITNNELSGPTHHIETLSHRVPCCLDLLREDDAVSNTAAPRRCSSGDIPAFRPSRVSGHETLVDTAKTAADEASSSGRHVDRINIEMNMLATCTVVHSTRRRVLQSFVVPDIAVGFLLRCTCMYVYSTDTCHNEELNQSTARRRHQEQNGWFPCCTGCQPAVGIQLGSDVFVC